MIRKTVFAALPLAAAVLLCACGAPAAQSAVSDATSAESQSSADTVETQTADSFRQLTAQGNVSMDANAFYGPTCLDTSLAVIATKVDLSTGQQTVLCNKADCAHNSDACDAYICSGSPTDAAVLIDGEKLYYLYSGQMEEGTESHSYKGAYLDVSDLDGQNRKRIASFDVPETFTRLTSGADTHWYTDGASLYVDQTNAVLQINADGLHTFFAPLITDNATGLYSDGYELEQYKALGCWQGKLVLCHAMGFTPPQVSDADRTEWENGGYDTESKIYQNYQAEYEAMAAKAQYEIALLDGAGNVQPTDITFTRSQGSIDVSLNDGKVVRMVGPTDAATELWSADLATGEVISKAIPKAGAWSNAAPTLYGNKVVLTQQEACYIWDTENDTMTEQPATWFKDSDAPHSPFVMLTNGAIAFLHTGNQSVKVPALTPGTGVPYLADGLAPSYGIMALSDYLEGDQDWQQVTLIDPSRSCYS